MSRMLTIAAVLVTVLVAACDTAPGSGGTATPPGTTPVAGTTTVLPGYPTPGAYPAEAYPSSGDGYLPADASDASVDQTIAQLDRLVEAGNLDAALESASVAVAAHPDPRLRIARARVMLALRRHDDAIREATAVLEQDPTNVEALLTRGIAHSRLAQYEAGLADFDAVLAIEPTSFTALTERGLIRVARGDFEQAQADLDAAIAAAPEYAPGYAGRATLYVSRGQIDLARMDYERAIALDSRNVTVMYEYGMVLLGLADVDGAVNQFKAVLANGNPQRDSLVMLQAQAQLNILGRN